jgi:hypothetical protein
MPEPQNLANHARYVAPFHFVAAPLIVVALVSAIVALVRAFLRGDGRLEAFALVALAAGCALLAWYSRIFALKAQDRAIRAEEGLRHLILTGKPLDSRLGLMQVVALRFASDAELPALAQRAADEGLRPGAIKRAIQSWRGDFDRV